MKELKVEIGPMVDTRRTLWLTGDVDTIRIGDVLVAENGENVRIDAIGMSNRKVRNGLSVLATGKIDPRTRTMYRTVK